MRTGGLGIDGSFASSVALPSRPVHADGVGVDSGSISELVRTGDLGIDDSFALSVEHPSRLVDTNGMGVVRSAYAGGLALYLTLSLT